MPLRSGSQAPAGGCLYNEAYKIQVELEIITYLYISRKLAHIALRIYVQVIQAWMSHAASQAMLNAMLYFAHTTASTRRCSHELWIFAGLGLRCSLLACLQTKVCKGLWLVGVDEATLSGGMLVMSESVSFQSIMVP